MFRKVFVAVLLILLSVQCFGQRDSTAVTDSLQRVMIYKQAFKTASFDKRIKDDEKAILKSLRKSLYLSKFDAKNIEYNISISEENILDQSGRWPLVLQNIAWGAGLYGWGLPYMLNVDDEKWFVASELMSFAGSFYLTYKYTENMDIPHSRAQMMRLGSGIGYHYGYALGKIAGVDFDFDSDDRGYIALLMASVPAGIWAGDKLYQRWQPTNGQSWAITLATAMGAMATSNIHYVVEKRPEEPMYFYEYDPIIGDPIVDDPYIDNFEKSDKYKKYEQELEDWERVQGILYLGAYPLSLYLGNKIFGEKDYSFGDATILYQGWGTGMIYSLMFMDMAHIDGDDSYLVGTMIGGLAGVYIYDKKLLSGFDYSIGESILLGLGTISGGTFGAGIGVIVEGKREVIQLGGLAGGIVGTWITRKILNPEKDGMAFGKNDDIKLSISPDLKYLPNSSVSSFVPGINVQLNF